MPKALYRQIFIITTFNLVDIQDTVVDFFNLDEDEEPYSQEFERMDIEMRNFLANCGLFLPIVSSVLPVFLLFQVLRLLRRICSQCLHKLILP